MASFGLIGMFFGESGSDPLDYASDDGESFRDGRDDSLSEGEERCVDRCVRGEEAGLMCSFECDPGDTDCCYESCAGGGAGAACGADTIDPLTDTFIGAASFVGGTFNAMALVVVLVLVFILLVSSSS